MIGRAAQGQPWLCGQIATHLETGETPAAPTRAQQQAILRRHVAALHTFYGDFMGVRIARKHLSWYLQYGPNYTEHRRLFNHLELPGEQLRYIDRLFNTDNNEVLAA
jgi:tRNA-dihydrouridine synthase B